jgi:hypothetical protein
MTQMSCFSPAIITSPWIGGFFDDNKSNATQLDAIFRRMKLGSLMRTVQNARFAPAELDSAISECSFADVFPE